MGKTIKAQRTQERTRGAKLEAMRKRTMREQPLCGLCLERGLVTIGTEMDHKVRLEDGGTDDPSNRWMLCHDCHSIKSARESGKQPHAGAEVTGVPRDPWHHWYTNGRSVR